MRLSLSIGSPIVTGPQSFTILANPGVYALSGKAANLTYTPLTVSTGYPDSTNTGYQNAPGYTGTLTDFGASNGGQIQSNTTYNFKRFRATDTNFSASNVVFNGCTFESTWSDGWACKQTGGNNVTFNYCTFGPPLGTLIPNASWPSAGYRQGVSGFSSNVRSYQINYGVGPQYCFRKEGGTSTTLNHCDLWGGGNMLDLPGGSSTNILNCWIHDASWEGPNVEYHQDGPGYLEGVQGATSGYTGPSNVLIQNCTIASLGNTNAIAFQYATGGYNNIVVDGCYFGGFGYTIDMCHGHSFAQNLRFSNNILDADMRWGYGPMYGQTQFCFGPSKTTNAWYNNKIITTTAYTTDGPYTVNLSDNGKFIYPDGSKSNIDYVDGVP